eukprot:CAMPEP_0115544540 /NCGR_PEP_ID=MMETSP0271-20121206/92140_1 /TAXON_ID=71861 /ORGANISM="Scrippsiella trochoidea, Strain CCMP3099" /LENGTH=51 /DNA_ID=CAMNT_0002977857 /DNA_START=364 /DNA_END=516 /DNA_ORIENTATION=+
MKVLRNWVVGAIMVEDERGTKMQSCVTKPRERMSAITAAAPSEPARSPSSS